jgi:hypothetical protein
MPTVSIPKFERFFRVVGDLDVDKADVKRYSEFVVRKMNDLFLRGQATAKANGRDVIQPHDLPITKGLQESIHEFRRVDGDIGLEPALDQLPYLPPLDVAYSAEVEAQIPEVVGGMSVALARAFTVLDPNVKNPQGVQWERAFKVFNLLL